MDPHWYVVYTGYIRIPDQGFILRTHGLDLMWRYCVVIVGASTITNITVPDFEYSGLVSYTSNVRQKTSVLKIPI